MMHASSPVTGGQGVAAAPASAATPRSINYDSRGAGSGIATGMPGAFRP